MKRLILFSIFVFITVSCAPSQEEIQETVQAIIAETQAAEPTARFIPVPPTTPTATPDITPTWTITPSKTSMRIPTATLDPRTMTPTRTIMPSRTAELNRTKFTPLTVTARIRNVRLTSTARAESALATKIAQYQPVDIRDFMTYPDEHAGEKIVMRGRIFNINEEVVQIWVLGDKPVYVQMLEKVSGVYEDDYITVYGAVYGSWCFINEMGNESCQPALYEAWYEKK